MKSFSHRIARSVSLLLLIWGVAALVIASPVLAQDGTSTEEPVEIEGTAAAGSGAEPPPGEIAPEDEEQDAAPAIPRNPEEILEALGWPFVAPFLAASFISIWFGVERFVVLRKGRVIPRAFVERFIKHLQQGSLEPNKALQLCEENGSPTAIVFAHGIRKWGKPSVEVEQAILDGGERQVASLRKHLRVLNGVATVTPLIGLLGTVIGMIKAFNEIAGADAMGKASQLASGIALALLTTAAGLMIAIPSLILYMYLAGKVDVLVMEMDHYAQRVVELISGEGIAARKPEHRSISKKKITA
jgi:biopolymer transport protein ExbB